MNTKIISAIAFKLFAIYAVVLTILAIPAAAGIFVAMDKQSNNFDVNFFWPAAIITMSVVITFITFKILWKLGNSVIENISEINVTDNEFDIVALEKALFIFLGIYFSISAFLEIPSISTSLWVHSHTPTGISLTDYAWLISITAQLIIGLHLIKKPSQWLSFVRNMGLSDKKTL